MRVLLVSIFVIIFLLSLSSSAYEPVMNRFCIDVENVERCGYIEQYITSDEFVKEITNYFESQKVVLSEQDKDVLIKVFNDLPRSFQGTYYFKRQFENEYLDFQKNIDKINADKCDCRIIRDYKRIDGWTAYFPEANCPRKSPSGDFIPPQDCYAQDIVTVDVKSVEKFDESRIMARYVKHILLLIYLIFTLSYLTLLAQKKIMSSYSGLVKGGISGVVLTIMLAIMDYIQHFVEWNVLDYKPHVLISIPLYALLPFGVIPAFIIGAIIGFISEKTSNKEKKFITRSSKTGFYFGFAFSIIAALFGLYHKYIRFQRPFYLENPPILLDWINLPIVFILIAIPFVSAWVFWIISAVMRKQGK